MLRRYVHGSNAEADDPLIWYEGAAIGTSTRRYVHADTRGSIVAVTNYQGTSLYTNTYDEYGIPGAGNTGRFQYTGQTWLPEIGLYYYKARVYSPTLGRFLQTDPIGYEDQFNLYAYVANDPVNLVDPTGLEGCGSRIEGVNNCSGASYFAYEAAQAGKAALEAGNKALEAGERALETTGEALSNTGDALRRLPGNVGRQISGTLGCAARMDCSEDVRVGRWMSQEEADAMVETGLVQRPRNGTDQSYVTSPANADEFRRQAPEGSVFVTYRVRGSSVYSSSAGGRSYVSTGPNSLPSRVDVRRGLPAHTTPRARNVYIWTWP